VKFERVVSADGYGRWIGGRYIISMYSQWSGVRGTFYMAYDAGQLSKRLADGPAASFDEAVKLCEAHAAR
jgi:hypothetical protein